MVSDIHVDRYKFVCKANCYLKIKALILIHNNKKTIKGNGDILTHGELDFVLNM